MGISHGTIKEVGKEEGAVREREEQRKGRRVKYLENKGKEQKEEGD